MRRVGREGGGRGFRVEAAEGLRRRQEAERVAGRVVEAPEGA